MMLIGYIFGISHDRRLCEEIICNITCRWYYRLNLNDKALNYFSLSKVRDRCSSEVFEKFFAKVLERCRMNRLVKSKSIMTDSSLIEVNAAIDSMIIRDKNTAKGEVTPIKLKRLLT